MQKFRDGSGIFDCKVSADGALEYAELNGAITRSGANSRRKKQCQVLIQIVLKLWQLVRGPPEAGAARDQQPDPHQVALLRMRRVATPAPPQLLVCWCTSEHLLASSSKQQKRIGRKTAKRRNTASLLEWVVHR
ncbi:hypothetical protein ISCGN_028645 [Ixodes scapularis]